MTEQERFAEVDSMAAWAQTNRFAAIACGIPDPRPPVRYVSQHVAARAEAAWSDKLLGDHLDAVDRLEECDKEARRHLNEMHIAEAVDMVQTNLQDQIDAGRVPKELGDQLMAIFERIESVAMECSWADLARRAA